MLRAPVLAALLVVSCSFGSPRYLVTAEPVVVGRGITQCIALETRPVEQVWSWGPGRTGCGTRSTGPDLFLITDARITRDEDTGVVSISYSLPLIPAGELPVVLVVEGETLQSADTRQQVALEPMPSLDVPELPRQLSD